MSNLKQHAIREFKATKWLKNDGTYCDEMQQMMCEHVLKLLEVFSDEGHSGSSAPYVVNLFKTLAMFEPVVPLSGEDDEWNDVGEGMYQNNRCSHVFKENGKAYDIEGRIFREPDGSCYIGKGSRVPVTFPYVPKREYVDVEEGV
jgi:hypothetical protein